MTPQKEAALAASWKRTLMGIPSMIGRLAYLASLRNSNTGLYEHAGLSDRVGDEDADRLLRRSHQEVFSEWLCYGLQRQRDEIEEYLAGLRGNSQEIIENWLSIEPYTVWMPRESVGFERKLFNSDLSIVLELIREGYAAGFRGRDSSPGR